jgi:glycosyltransferase involved in cell wall biosynthesis
MTPPVRIGIDARAAAEVPAGRGRYVRELLRALAKRDDPHRYVLYVRRRWNEPLDERFSWWERELPESVWHLHAARAANRECDVFLATNSYVTPWFLRIPTALVVHDLIPFQADVHPNRRAAVIERLTIRRALRRASLVVCDSHATRRDLLRLWPSVKSKSMVVQLAVGEVFSRPLGQEALDVVKRRHDLSKPFVLCAGTLEPRKNLVRVLDAYARLSERLRERHLLVLVGPRGWEFDEILERAGALGGRVKLLGHVPDDDLAALYMLCEVFCYPSLYEGFGLPLLEAMSAGAPSITSNVSSLPEVGGQAVRYIDPTSVEEIAAALTDLLESEPERQRLGERAREQAALFSWERAAHELVRHLVALAASKRS